MNVMDYAPTFSPTQSVSIIIPVLDESASIGGLIEEVKKAMGDEGWEIVVVDDGSTDGSDIEARRFGATVLRSARNLGKSAALQAGFDATSTQVVITIDGDGQDDPSEIPRLIEALEQSDLVTGWKRTRKDTAARRMLSKLFAMLSRKVSGLDLHDFNCGLKAYRREVLDAIHLYGDRHRLTPILASAAGFTVSEIEVNHRPRLHGRSHCGLERLIRGPLDLITIVFLTRFGQRPLHVFGFSGALLGVIGFSIGLYLSYLRLVLDESIGDRPLLILAVLLIVAGVQLFSVGLLGEMLLAFRRSPTGAFRPTRVDGPVSDER